MLTAPENEFPPPDPRARKYDTYTDVRGLPRHPDADCQCPPFWETQENVEEPT